RRASRRPRRPVRDPARRGPSRVLVRRARDDRRHVRRGADAGGGDVRAGDLRPGGHADGRGEAVTRWTRWIPALVVAAVGVGCYVRFGPIPAELLDLREVESTVVVDRNGEVLYESRGAEGGRTSWMAADQLPPALADATVAAEDRRFFRHI